MTAETPNAEPPVAVDTSFVGRLTRILLQPTAEWGRIDAERTSVGAILRGWVLILAAIPAVATLIGSLVFGYGFFGITYRPSVGEAVGSAILRYVLAVAGTFLLALLIDALAPQFGGTKDRVQAMKVAAYSATAAWLAGIFGLIPTLAMLGLLGLYSLYLLWLGLPRLMKVADDKAAAYTLVTIAAAVLLFLIVGAVAASLGGMFASRSVTIAGHGTAGTITVPGAGSVDLSGLQGAGDRARSGKPVQPVAPASLQALLPAALGDYRRTEIASAGANAGGLGGSEAEAAYQNGDNRIRLKITDLAAAGAIAALGSALNVESSRQTETGYERTGKVDGRMTNEKWNSEAHDGSYGVLVADRFMVEAEGHAPTVDAFKAAVGTVPVDRLESLAR